MIKSIFTLFFIFSSGLTFAHSNKCCYDESDINQNSHTKTLYALYDRASKLYDVENYKEAFPLFKQLACKGNAEAQDKVASMYIFGRGVNKSKIKAVDWWTRAAKQGHAGAQFELAWMYYAGRGTFKNMQKAIEWYELAAKQGHKGAQNNLAWMHYDGQGTPKNETKAIEWYKKAAEQGHSDAQYMLDVKGWN